MEAASTISSSSNISPAPAHHHHHHHVSSDSLVLGTPDSRDGSVGEAHSVNIHHHHHQHQLQQQQQQQQQHGVHLVHVHHQHHPGMPLPAEVREGALVDEEPHTPTASRKRKERKCLDIETKLHIVQLVRGGKSHISVANEYCVSRTTISKILKSAGKLEGMCDRLPTTRNRKCLRLGDYAELEEELWKWYKEQTTRPSGCAVKTKASELAQQNPHLSHFKASNGWLDGFKSRHQIASSRPPRTEPLRFPPVLAGEEVIHGPQMCDSTHMLNQVFESDSHVAAAAAAHAHELTVHEHSHDDHSHSHHHSDPHHTDHHHHHHHHHHHQHHSHSMHGLGVSEHAVQVAVSHHDSQLLGAPLGGNGVGGTNSTSVSGPASFHPMSGVPSLISVPAHPAHPSLLPSSHVIVVSGPSAMPSLAAVAASVIMGHDESEAGAASPDLNGLPADTHSGVGESEGVVDVVSSGTHHHHDVKPEP